MILCAHGDLMKEFTEPTHIMFSKISNACYLSIKCSLNVRIFDQL